MNLKKMVLPLAFVALGLYILMPGDIFKYIAGVGVILAGVLHFLGKE